MPGQQDANKVGLAWRWLPWCLALLGLSADLLLFWPGQVSFDSAYTWWQARGGTTANSTPPALMWAWRATLRLHDGPEWMYLLHLLMFWTGVALLVRALQPRPIIAAAMVLLIGLAPPILLLRGHVWSDVGLFSALTLAIGLLVFSQVSGRRSCLLVVLPVLFYVAALRQNAAPAVVPLVVWVAWLLNPAASAARVTRVTRASGVALMLLLLIFSGTRVLDRSVEHRVPLWPSLAQFDLAALSIAENRMLLPDFMIGPGLDVPDLAQAFRSWSNIPMLQNTRHGMQDPLMKHYSDAELAELRRAWVKGVVDHPHAWLRHRARVARGLFGTRSEEWPAELGYIKASVQYRDNPPLARNTRVFHVGLMKAADKLRATPLLAAWPYLLPGLFVVPVLWRRRRTPDGTAGLVLLASAALYTLPLLVFAPSAELRYLGWPCVASLLAFACAASTMASWGGSRYSSAHVGNNGVRAMPDTTDGVPAAPTKGLDRHISTV